MPLLFFEPTGENTAPVAAIAALYQQEIDPVLLILPADHLIKDAEGKDKKKRAETIMASCKACGINSYNAAAARSRIMSNYGTTVDA